MPEDEAEVVSWTAAPCAGCRTLRRRCVPGCVFAPYFPAGGDPSRFAAVHRVFGASNAASMLADVELPAERQRAADKLVEEALARVRDPALGCMSYVGILQMLVEKAREQVDGVREEIAREFGPEAASEPVDVAAAGPEARLEAKAQAERALEDARKQDAKLLATRHAIDLKWRQWQLCQAAEHGGEGPRVPGGRGQKDQDASQQMAETEDTVAAVGESSSSEQTMLTPQAAAGTELPEGNGHRPRQEAAEQHRHLAAHHASVVEPGIPDGHGQLHQQMSEGQQSTAAAEAAREEALTSEQVPAAALQQQHHDSATRQLAGTGTSIVDREAAEELAKKLEAMRRFAAAQRYHDPTAAHYGPMGLDVTPRLQQPPQPLQMADAAAAEAAWQQASTSEQVRATALQHHDSATTRLAGTGTDGHARQQLAETGRWDQDVMIRRFAAAQQYSDPAAAQYASVGLDVTPRLQQQPQPQETALQMAEAQQQAAALEVGSDQDLVLTLMPQLDASELPAKQDMMMRLLAASVLQFDNLVAPFHETELGITPEHGHPDVHQQTVQQMFQEQQLADAVGVTREPNTTMQQVTANTNAEHGSDSGMTVAFQPPGSAEAAAFLVEQQPPPLGQTAMALGLQLDSSLLPLLPSLGQRQPHAQLAHQQITDGGDEGQSSDLNAYLYS